LGPEAALFSLGGKERGILGSLFIELSGTTHATESIMLEEKRLP
jgi:hypothetical protein